MNTFIVNRPTPGGAATKEKIIDDKIPIYDSKAAAEADLANIEEGAIVATKDTGATEKVVDVVQDGNMNPVTSNAVSKYGIRFDTSSASSTPDIAHSFIKFRKGEGIITMDVQDENLTGVSIDFDYRRGIIRLYDLTNGSASDEWIFNHS